MGMNSNLDRQNRLSIKVRALTFGLRPISMDYIVALEAKIYAPGLLLVAQNVTNWLNSISCCSPWTGRADISLRRYGRKEMIHSSVSRRWPSHNLPRIHLPARTHNIKLVAKTISMGF